MYKIKFSIFNGEGTIIEAPQELFDTDQLDGNNMEDNGINISNLAQGLYSADLVINSSAPSWGYEDYDVDYYLENIEELINRYEPFPIDNPHQQIKQLNQRIKKLEGRLEEESGYIEIRGNKDANLVRLKKINDNVLNLEVGDCCIYTIDVDLTAEAFSGFLTNLYLYSNKSFIEVVKDHLKWDKEYVEEIMSKCIDNKKRK